MPDLRLCAPTDVPEGEAQRVTVQGRAFCVVNVGEDGFRVLDAECSHAHAYLDEGEVDIELGTIECPLHGSTFDMNTGSPKTLPATRPVAVFPATVTDSDVSIEV